MSDPYTDVFCSPPGENVLTVSEDGSLSHEWKAPDERPSTWKDSKKIQACDDDKISVIMVSDSGIIYYRILDVTVSWRGLGYGAKRQWLCHTHRSNACPHTKRMSRYRIDHPLLSSTSTTKTGISKW